MRNRRIFIHFVLLVIVLLALRGSLFSSPQKELDNSQETATSTIEEAQQNVTTSTDDQAIVGADEKTTVDEKTSTEDSQEITAVSDEPAQTKELPVVETQTTETSVAEVQAIEQPLTDEQEVAEIEKELDSDDELGILQEEPVDVPSAVAAQEPVSIAKTPQALIFSLLAQRGIQAVKGKITHGPLIIEKEQEGLKVTLFNIPASLTQAADEELTFRMTLKNPFKFKYLPEKEIIFDQLTLSFADNNIVLSTDINIFSQEKNARLAIGFESQTFTASISIASLELSQIHPLIGKTPLKSVLLRDVSIALAGIKNPELTIEGTVDLSVLQIPIIKLSDLKTIIKVAPRDFSFRAQLDPFKVQSIAVVKNAELFTSLVLEKQDDGKTNKDFTFNLSGDADITLPLDWGSVNTKLEGKFEDKILSFAADIKKDITILNVVTLKNTSIALASDGNFSVSGTSTVHVLDENIDFAATATVKVEKGKDPVVSLSGHALKAKPIKPFTKIKELKEVEPLNKFSIRDLTLSLNSKLELVISGITGLYGAEMKARLMATPKGVAVFVNVPPDWKITAAVPLAKDTILEEIPMLDAFIILSSRQFYDEELDIMVNKGVSLGLDADFNKKPFDKMKSALERMKGKFLQTPIPEKIKLYGTLSPSLQQNSLNYSMAMNLELLPDLSFKNLVLSVGGFPPAIFIKGNLFFKPPNQEDSLMFTGMLQVSPLEAFEVSIAGSMLGEWFDPFGIKGFSIKDVGAELGISVSLVGRGVKKVAATGAGAAAAGGGAAATTVVADATPDPITLSKIGVTGGLTIGDQTVAMAVRVTVEQWYKMILMGKLKYLYLTDIVKELGSAPRKILSRAKDDPKLKQAATELNKNLSAIESIFKKDELLKVLPDVKFDDLEFYLAPIGGKIGEIVFDPGLTIKGKMTVTCPNVKPFVGLVDIKLELLPLPIVKAVGSISEFTLAGLTVTGRGLDGKKGTADDGPTVDFEISLAKQSFMLSGEMELLGNHCIVDVDLSPSNISFSTNLKLPFGFDAQVKGNLVQTKGLPNFKIDGNVALPTPISFGKKDLEPGIKILEDHKKMIENKLRAELNDLDEKIRTKQEALKNSPVHGPVLRQLAEAKSNFSTAENEVKKHEANVKRLDDEIRKLEREMNIAFNINKSVLGNKKSQLLDGSWLLVSNKQDRTNLFTDSLDPMKIDFNAYIYQYPLLCWNLWDGARQTLESASQNVSNAASNVANEASTAVRVAVDPNKWARGARLTQLKTERNVAAGLLEAAKVPFKAAQQGLTVLEETVKNLDPSIALLQAERAARATAMGTQMAALDAGITTFKTVTLVAPAADLLMPIVVKKLSFTTNLHAVATGELPTVTCDIKAFNKIDKTITFKADLKNIPAMIKEIALKAFLLQKINL